MSVKGASTVYILCESKESLCLLSARRFCELNREKADELFGTDSARLFPKDDLYQSLKRR